jgi:NarL family two-component system response regulator LiaR
MVKTSRSTANRRRKPAARPSKAPSAKRIRIVVADNQAIDRLGLVALLGTQRDFSIVGEATTATDAAALCRAKNADVLLYSIRLPHLNGVSAIAAVRESHPATRIIALAEHGAGNCIVLNPPHRDSLSLPVAHSKCLHATDCLQLAVSEGALGALRRDAEPEELYQAVRAVASGRAWYDARTATTFATNGCRTLSSRELDVAALIAEGRSNKEIAGSLSISEPTVKKHVGHILEKLGLQDRLQVGIYVVRNPLLLK